MQAAVDLIFGAGAVLLWGSTFGYWFTLWVVARVRRAPSGAENGPAAESLPPLTVIVPVLNEARYIEPKLADLQKTQYPFGRLRIVVIDGGSRDRTVALATRCPARPWPVEVVRVAEADGKAHQVSVALKQVDMDYAVLTDVDATLDPGCIAQLATELVSDERLAMVGARVVPVTGLPEERFHWRVVNALWCLEGRAFGASAVSGVCHAMRLAACRSESDLRCAAEDVELTMRATWRGYRTRTSKSAIAWEHRVPHSFREMLRFRRRRAYDYRNLLARGVPSTGFGGVTGFVRTVRLWQMTAVPVLGVSLVAAGAVLLVMDRWQAVASAAALFLLSLLLWIRSIAGPDADGSHLKTCLRWGAAMLITLLSLSRPKRERSPRARVEVAVNEK